MSNNPKVKNKNPYSFLNDTLFHALQCNGIAQREHEKQTGGRGYLEFNPVVKLFTPDAQATWLLTEISPGSDGQIAFGLCDLGLGYPELGYVSLSELAALRGVIGLTVERDKGFDAEYPLTVYADLVAQCINQAIQDHAAYYIRALQDEYDHLTSDAHLEERFSDLSLHFETESLAMEWV